MTSCIKPGLLGVGTKIIVIKQQIAFVGLGAIGAPMAFRLHKAGFDVIGCNKNGAILEMFAEAGIRTTEHVGDCADRDVLIFMVADDAQLRTCVDAPDGVLARVGKTPPWLFIVMSTVSPDTIRAVATSAHQFGIRILDAPVIGGPLAAKAGSLSIMIGGESDAVEAARPLLAAMGSTLHLCGPAGTGALTKIINKLVGVTTLMLLADAIRLADVSGLDLTGRSAVMEMSSGRNAGSVDWPRMRVVFADFAGDLPRVGLFLRINTKDTQLALKLGTQAGIAMPILQAAFEAVSHISDQEMYDRIGAFTRNDT